MQLLLCENDHHQNSKVKRNSPAHGRNEPSPCSGMLAPKYETTATCIRTRNCGHIDVSHTQACTQFPVRTTIKCPTGVKTSPIGVPKLDTRKNSFGHFSECAKLVNGKQRRNKKWKTKTVIKCMKRNVFLFFFLPANKELCVFS